MKCLAEHTAYQPQLTEYVCPDCGQAATDDPQGLVIDEPDMTAQNDCPLLHTRDCLVCYNCDYETTALEWANRLAKTAGMKPCSACGGSGLVKE
jgi:DNA-directed RNA polymerase subunit RPC12/RpoP